MARGRIYLLGTFQVYTAQDVLLEGASPRVQSLCAYLALHQGTPVDRRRLAFLLWPRVSEPVARRNLRQYLHRLRQFLAPLDPAGQLVIAESMSITFDPHRTLWVDAQEFLQHLTAAENSEGPTRVAALRRAVDLYRGDFAQNIYDEWCQQERERFRHQYEFILQTLVNVYQDLNRLDDAIYWAERALQVNPLQESLYRTLMRLYAQAGNRAQALETYERCRHVLWKELQATPMPETEQLYRELLLPAEVREEPVRTPPPPSETPTPPPTAPRDQPLPPASTPPNVKPAPPLIGREEDLRWLDNVLIRAGDHGALILVEGEAGIGKTRLLSEWLSRRREDFFLLEAEGGEFEHVIPYHPLKEAIREGLEAIPWEDVPYRERWQAALVYLLPHVANVLPEFASTPRGHVDRWEILEGLGWFLRGLAEKRPVILWLDEAHWADHSTWQTVAYIGQRLAPHVPLYLVLTYRSEDVTDPNRQVWRRLTRASFVHRRVLQRLTRAQTYDLARSILGPGVDRRILEKLYVSTEGIPLFVVETARSLLHLPEHRVFIRSAGETISLPDRVRQVVESRLDMLPEEYRSLLQIAAVFGRTFTVPLLVRLADVEESTLFAALDAWLARGLVEETGHGYTFSHPLVRHVVYNELSLARRQWLHRRIALMLQQDAEAQSAVIAHHFSESDRPAEAIPFFMQAAADALRVRAYHSARSCALEVLRLWRQRATRAPEDEATRIDVNLHLAQAYSLSNMSDEALTLLEETLRLAERLGDPKRLAQVRIRLSQVFWHRGVPRAAQDHARVALRWAQTGNDPEMYAAALRMLGRTAITLSAFNHAVQLLRRHLSEIDPGDPRQAVAWSYLAVAWSRLGNWERAFEAAQRAVQIAEMQKRPTSMALASMHLSFVQAERYLWAAAQENARQGLEYTHGLGFSPVTFMLQALRAYTSGMLGDEQAPRVLQDLLSEARQENYRVLVHLVHYFLAHVYLHQKQYTQALQQARLTVRMASEYGDRWAEAVATRLEADALSALPHPDWVTIEKRLVHSVTLLRRIGARPELARSYVSLRRLYDRAARMAWAVDCHFRAVTIFEELGMIEELRAAQGQSGRKVGPAREAISAPLTGPAWLRSEPSVETPIDLEDPIR